MTHFTLYSLSFDILYHPHCISLRNHLQLCHPQLQSISLTRSNHSCLTITGATFHVLSARADIIHHYSHEIQIPLDSICPSIPYRVVAKRKLHESLEMIANTHHVEIVVDYSSLKVCLIGVLDRIDRARIEVLLLMDRYMNLYTNSIDIPVYYVNILYHHVQSVMEDTNTNIYVPALYSLFNNTLFDTTCTLSISGESVKDVERAISLLNKLLPPKMKTVCNMQSILHPRKRDWLLLYQQTELTKMMRENGSFIVFPPYGDTSDDVCVYGENMMDIERTLRLLNYKTSHLFQASIQVDQCQFITHLSECSGADIMYQTDNHLLTITGTKKQIQSIVELLSKHQNPMSTVFSIELALDQKDFISGKKNGKINKIMKSCEAHIHFKEYNEFNFIIIIQSDDFYKARDGLDSLQNELPAEISFYVPEICHRRIIGVGGKNIQRVMKQYGVYVKFSSNEELASTIGYFDIEHNVIARTPEKNIRSLDKLKASIMEFISFQKDRDYISKQEYVPSFVHRMLLHHHGRFLKDKGKLYNCRIRWPARDGSDYVTVVGPESHIEEMQIRIRHLLPQSTQINIPSSVTLNILASEHMEEVIHSIYSTTHIHLILPYSMLSYPTHHTPNVKIVQSTTFSFFHDHHTFKLYYDTHSKHRLNEAKDMLNTFFNIHSNTVNDLDHISPSVMHRIDYPESYEDIHTQQNYQQKEEYHQWKKSMIELAMDSEEWNHRTFNSQSNRIIHMNPRQRSTSLLPSQHHSIYGSVKDYLPFRASTSALQNTLPLFNSRLHYNSPSNSISTPVLGTPNINTTEQSHGYFFNR